MHAWDNKGFVDFPSMPFFPESVLPSSSTKTCSCFELTLLPFFLLFLSLRHFAVLESDNNLCTLPIFQLNL